MVLALNLTSALLAGIGLWAAVPDWPRHVSAALRNWSRLRRGRGKPRITISSIGLYPGPPPPPKGWVDMASLPERQGDLLAFTRDMAQQVDWLTREAERVGNEVRSLHYDDQALAEQAQVRARQAVTVAVPGLEPQRLAAGRQTPVQRRRPAQLPREMPVRHTVV